MVGGIRGKLRSSKMCWGLGRDCEEFMCTRFREYGIHLVLSRAAAYTGWNNAEFCPPLTRVTPPSKTLPIPVPEVQFIERLIELKAKKLRDGRKTNTRAKNDYVVRVWTDDDCGNDNSSKVERKIKVSGQSGA